MSELIACPFCGKQVTPRLTPKGYIWCDNCGVPFDLTDEKFNTRPLEDALLARAVVAEERVALLESAWLTDEAIQPDGGLRPSVRDTVLRAEKAEARNYVLRNALSLVLDQVDYTAGACRVNEMVGAVLGKNLIETIHKILKGGEK